MEEEQKESSLGSNKEWPYDPAIPFLFICVKELKSGSQRDICNPMFIAALCIMAKIQKQPKCPSVDEWINKMWGIYNGILFCLKKEGNPTICNNMDKPRGHYAK